MEMRMFDDWYYYYALTPDIEDHPFTYMGFFSLVVFLGILIIIYLGLALCLRYCVDHWDMPYRRELLLRLYGYDLNE